MVIAIPVWQGRVSPVLDVAGQLLIVAHDGSAETARRHELLPDEGPELRAQRLRTLGVQTLLCGAISRPLEDLLVSSGIEVVPRICGEAEEVLRAYLSAELYEDRFAMPGCCGQKRRRCHGRRGGNHRQPPC